MNKIKILLVFGLWILIWLKLSLLDDLKIKKHELELSTQVHSSTWSVLSFDKFWKVHSIIEKKGVDSEKLNNIKNLEDSIISWLVRSLDDPYSLYMTEKENEEFKEDMSWNFEWIWAELSMKNEMVTVVSPLKDSPAINAGLLPQDIIIKVDDKEISWWSLFDVVKVIRWPKWETVSLTVIRKWESDFIEIPIIRDVIKLNSVKYEKKGSIAYISINQFWDKTTKEFFAALSDAKADNSEWIILDLRFNWWWYLDWSVIVASPFLEIWEQITEIASKQWSEKKRAAHFDANFRDKPLVVIINWWSASASEIVAWALRDHKRAVLVWEKSFWKGTVQELVPLSWKSSLRITTAKWYTPNWINIHKSWITPDVIIPWTYDQMKNWNDIQLDVAIKLLEEGDFDQRYFQEKPSLTWSHVHEYNGSWEIIMKQSILDQ